MSPDSTVPGVASQENAASNRRILVVDDNPRIHDDFRTILVRTPDGDDYLADLEAELFGEVPPEKSAEVPFEVDSAHQGHEGLELVKRALGEGRPYAVAFVDIRMPPGWDGVETIRRLWEVDPSLQVVICTAYSDYSWEETVDLLDPVEQFLILKKPFDTVVVRQLAHALTEKWSRGQRERARMADLEVRADERSKDLERARQLLEQEREERAKVETLLRHTWSLDQDSGQALREPLVDLEEVLAHFRRLAETRAERGLDHGDDAVDGLLDALPDAVERAMHGLTRVADTLRALGGIEPERAASERPHTNLDRALARLLADRPESSKGVHVTCDQGGDANVACRESDVRAVLRELFDNAIEAASASTKGRVRLRTWREGDRVAVEVADNGPGVPNDLHDRVFDTWFSTRGRAGLGLATVRDVLARTGGEVRLGAAEGGGTAFQVRWPAVG